MAIAGDTYDSIKRATSYSLSIGAESTLSIEDLGTVDIDAVVNKRWVLDEVIGSLQSHMAILSGGRDRRGAPIITMYATEHGDFRPSNVGKVLSYLSKVPDESVQGLGFTIVLDAQHVSWQITKHVLKSLQLTFVEHIHQLIIVKPKAFWQRQKTGVNVIFKKSRFKFPVTMLESTADLFHHLQVSQVTSDLGGTIKYNHQQWIDTQRILEKHLIQLLNRLDGYEHVREQLDLQENPATLLESRDSVRRHVDAKDIISKVDLDCECEAVSHAIAQLRPCTNPDFLACFSRLEELSCCLQTRREQLQRMWDEKGTKLDKVVQLRKFEHDSDQMLHWISETTVSLSRDHTDIGDSLSTAEQRRQSFTEFQGQIANQYQEISRVISMGERLINARHHAADVMQGRNKRLREKWEVFSGIVEDRHTIMELSVMFHERQHKFFHQVDQWIDQCSSTESPSTTAQANELLRQHQAIQDQYQQLYNTVRKEGHRLIEKLRKPVGDSSLPSNFVLATRHIKEILEGLFDEHNWLEEQWGQRNRALHNTLHLRQYQDEAVVVYTWLSDRGWVFLLSNVTVGADAPDAQRLIQQHDSFEGEAKEIYAISLQLFGKARKMAESGECERGMIEHESSALEEAVNGFAANLDERRDILVQACTFYKNMEMLSLELRKLTGHIPRDQFTGQPSEVESRLRDFQAKRATLDELAKQVFSHCDSLVTQLEAVMESTSEEGHAINYTPAIRSVQQHMGEVRSEKRKVDESCARKETRWSLTLQLARIQEEAQEHLSQLESWCSEQSQTELEPSTNTLDSQLQLDALQGQYDNLFSTHNDIAIRARSIARETEQLDSIMFGSTPSSAHPVAVTVEELEGKMAVAKERLEAVARPRLKQLRDCLDYHLLQQRAHTLTSALHTITTSISQVSPVGHSLSSAETVLQQQNNNHQKLQAISHDVDRFCEEVEECIQRQHYEATHLAMLARSLQENKGRASRAMVDRVRVAKGGVGFYKGVDRLASIMEKCRTHFNSKDTVHSVSDAQRLLSTLHELKDLVEQATEGVRSQGKQLLEVLVSVPSPPSRRKNGDEQFKSNPIDTRSLSVSTDMGSMDRSKQYTRLRHSSDNLIDAITEDSESTGGEEGTDSPKLLVSPRKSRPALKSYKSSPVSLANSPDQIMIETQLYKVDQQMCKLAMLWEHRKTQLETAQIVIEFMEQVPQVLSWLETRGAEFLRNKHNYGRSKEEVLQLITEHDRALEGEVHSMRERVEGLMASYQRVESSGHRELNQLRGVASSLEWKWNQFENDMEQRQNNLQSSLRFQDNLFKASNWCQKSQQFLDSMSDKIESCDTSEEATRLKEELTVYFSYTQEEQQMRVEEAKEISVKLHSNLLVEMAAQIDQSTQQTFKDLHTSQDDLDRLHDKLVQIESEKDKAMRLKKQRKRVLEELTQTEEVYVADLKLIVEKCRPRFVSDVLPNSLKGKEHVIFSNIHEIDAFHRLKLLPQLKNSMDLDSMAVVFMEHADEMADVYVPYCKNKMESEDLLASHRTYLSRMQSMFGIDTPLSSLLIKPVQRITKYPLLLKDAIKYTTLLGLPTDTLEGALIAVERILDETNNAIHLSHLEIFEEQLSPLGKLYLQCSLLVSEPKFAIKAEKERQVFVFDSALLFARKVLLGPAKFKYEYKSKIPITAGLQLGEFVDGEPFKFTITTADHKLHLKAASLETKQVAVRAIRTAILGQNQEALMDAAMYSRQGNYLLGIDRFTKDLLNPSPKPSPPTHRRANGSVVTGSSPTMNGFDRYQVTSDYTSEGDPPLSLKKGAVVEVLDSKIEDKWFVRTLTSSPEAGWIPSVVLEQMSREEVDGRGRTTITSGPTHAPQKEKLRQFRSQTAFGSRDLQSQQVISALKKVTLQGEADEEEEEGGSSLDLPRQLSTESPRLARSAPQSRHNLSAGSLDQGLLQVTPNGTAEEGGAVPGNTRSTSWSKNRNTRRAVYRRKNKDRALSLGSDRSESPTEKMHSGSSEESIHENESKVEEVDPEKAKKAQERIQHIIAEILHTEQEYVSSLDMCINGYKKEVHNPTIPSVLQGKEKLIFGNIQAVFDFHSSHFLPALKQAGEEVERVAKCFLDHACNFEVYITYCENKPKSESFLWTYQHTGGTFFEDIQNQLKHRQGLASFLIKPVQRISQYQLLLRDLQKSAQKAGLTTPQLGQALELMQDVPKRANDAMTLSMICGYDGNISASGQLIMHEEFTVYERSRWTGASRHIFLMDQRLILTKEKDADGLYVYKDSLKVHSLSIVEKQDDNPCRFAVGTGPINSWDQYYVLEASSPEKKSTWVEAIKTILKQQFELLKALRQPNTRTRSQTVGPAPLNSVAMINLSDDSEDEGMEDVLSPSPFIPTKGLSPGMRRQTLSAATVGETTAATPTIKTRPLDLYVVAEDCAPPKENEGILYIRKGQMYDVIDKSSDWWFARLVRDVTPDGTIGRQGWVAGSFLDKFSGELSFAEEAAIMSAINPTVAKKSATMPLPSHTKKQPVPKSPKGRNKMVITSSFQADEPPEEEEEEKEEARLQSKSPIMKVPQIVTHLTDETVIVSRTVRLRCKISKCSPEPTMEWSLNGRVITHDRAFTSLGEENCLLRLQNVTQQDEGVYTCTVCNRHGCCSSSAKLTVIGPPSPPGRPKVKPVTSTSVRISWNPPTHTGHSPITLYLIECKDILSGRWSTVMKRITEPSTVMDDLMPGTEYVFRVIAGNHIGSSQPSLESEPVQTASYAVGTEFSFDPFYDHYNLMNILARGQFSEVHECLHCSTQQSYAAKLIPLTSGDHAHKELEMLSRLSHSNIINVTAAYQTDQHYILLFRLLKGQNLFEYTTVMDCFSEHHAACCTEQLLSALEYLHNLNIVHLAIRPENITVMKSEMSADPVLKLLHFSRAQELSKENTDVVVKPQYEIVEFEAPEVLKDEPISTTTDMWSLGVLLYIFLGGTSPFLVDSVDLTKDNICSGRYSFPAKNFKGVSESAKEVISGLLVGDPSGRLTAAQCLLHPWIQSKQQNSNTLDLSHLKSYITTKKWQTTFTISSAEQ